MDNHHPNAIDGLAAALKWATRLLVVLYAAAIVTPLVLFGLTDKAIILASIVTMGVPATFACLYIFGGTIVCALWPAAEAIAHLGGVIQRVGRVFLRRHPS